MVICRNIKIQVVFYLKSQKLADIIKHHFSALKKVLFLKNTIFKYIQNLHLKVKCKGWVLPILLG